MNAPKVTKAVATPVSSRGTPLPEVRGGQTLARDLLL